MCVYLPLMCCAPGLQIMTMCRSGSLGRELQNRIVQVRMLTLCFAVVDSLCYLLLSRISLHSGNVSYGHCLLPLSSPDTHLGAVASSNHAIHSITHHLLTPSIPLCSSVNRHTFHAYMHTYIHTYIHTYVPCSHTYKHHTCMYTCSCMLM